MALCVQQEAGRLALSPRRAAWYPKPAATADVADPLPPEVQRLIEAACHAP